MKVINHLSIVVIYVDDLMIAGSILTIVNNIQNLFKSSFQIKDLEPITNTGPDIAYAVSQDLMLIQE